MGMNFGDAFITFITLICQILFIDLHTEAGLHACHKPCL